MNRTIVFAILALMAANCKDAGTKPFEDLPALPKVTVTQASYQEADIRRRVPDPVLLQSFTAAYGRKYSQDLKERICSYILARAAGLSLDAEELHRCIESTGQLRKEVIALPYLAERAKFNSVDSWIFELTWSPDSSLGHFRCYVIGAAAHDTLLFVTCR